jgi:hypothetical protein
MASHEVTLVARTPNLATAPTFTEICGIKWSALSYENEAGAPGRIDVGAPVWHLPADAKARLRDLIAAPCELWINRDATRVAAGPITSWTIQGGTITLYAPGLLGYLNYWAWDEDTTYTGIDQALIAAALINNRQALSYGSFGLDACGITATGVVRDLKLLAREGRNVLTVLQQMGARENGFELSVDPSSRAVTVHTPRRGVDRSGDIFLDRRNIASPEFFASVAPEQIASDVLGTSSSADGGALTSAAATSSVRTTFGRAQVARTWPDIKLQATLDDHTTRVAEDLSTMRVSVSPKLVPVIGVDVTDFDAGDQITYSYDAGLGTITSVKRIRTKQVRISGQKAKEELAVRFV